MPVDRVQAESSRAAIVLAGIAILLWSLLAGITVRLAHIPPFLLVGLSLSLGALPSLKYARSWFSDLKLLAFGTAGVFGYHFLLFMAFRLSPPVGVNLLNYLWPVLLVLISAAVLPGYRLESQHWIGGLISFSGAALVITSNHTSPSSPPESSALGYPLAIGAAVIWAVYSTYTKKWGDFPTSRVGGFCFLSGLLALSCHVLFEPSVSFNLSDGLWILVLGLGPLGLAFYAWDASLKRGDPRLIGALSYFTPVLSTLNLSLFTPRAVLGGRLLFALTLVVAGAMISSLWRKA